MIVSLHSSWLSLFRQSHRQLVGSPPCQGATPLFWAIAFAFITLEYRANLMERQ